MQWKVKSNYADASRRKDPCKVRFDFKVSKQQADNSYERNHNKNKKPDQNCSLNCLEKKKIFYCQQKGKIKIY